jgi:hypothetical protein
MVSFFAFYRQIGFRGIWACGQAAALKVLVHGEQDIVNKALNNKDITSSKF